MQFNSILYLTSVLEAIVEIRFLTLRVIILYIKKKKEKHSLSGTLVLLVAYLCMQSSVLMFDHYPVHTLLLLSNPDFSVL